MASESMQSFGLICISKEFYNSPRKARKQLLFEALAGSAKVEKILYLSAHRHRWQPPAKTTSFDPKIKVAQQTFLLPGERFAWIRSINRWYIYKKLCPCITHRHPWYIIFYNPLDVALVQKLRKFGPVIFDWTEDWADYYQNEIFRKHQMRAIQSADRVIAVTEDLAQRAEQLMDDPSKVLFLPNASAWPKLDNQGPINETKKQSVPKIGFVGHLGPWIDIDLIEQLAQTEPDWQWIIIGYVTQITIDRLKAFENIKLLGPRPFEQLQSLAAQCQILVAPYREGFNGDSSKLYDYLTLDLPIVCSDIETARRLGSRVKIATGLESWLHAIREGLAGNLRNQIFSRSKAAEHSWTSRSEVLAGWLSHIDL